jgi:hypothetical protein
MAGLARLLALGWSRYITKSDNSNAAQLEGMLMI